MSRLSGNIRLKLPFAIYVSHSSQRRMLNWSSTQRIFWWKCIFIHVIHRSKTRKSIQILRKQRWKAKGCNKFASTDESRAIQLSSQSSQESALEPHVHSGWSGWHYPPTLGIWDDCQSRLRWYFGDQANVKRREASWMKWGWSWRVLSHAHCGYHQDGKASLLGFSWTIERNLEVEAIAVSINLVLWYSRLREVCSCLLPCAAGMWPFN